MTNINELDLRLRAFVNAPDNFLDSIALVNALHNIPILASDQPYALDIEGQKVTPVFSDKEDLENFKEEQDSAKTQNWVERPTLDVLKEVIEKALAFLPEKERTEAVKKSCQRTFQALRIDVNSEFEVLYTFLDKLPEVLAPNGRVAILTFHSGEDRLVKRSFKQLKKQGVYSEICEEVIRPSAEECARNPRAKSTKMRWAIKSS